MISYAQLRLVKVPFTIQYAKEHVPASKWNNPVFIYINQMLTLAWAITFTLWFASYFTANALMYKLIQDIPLLITIFITIYFPNWYRFRKMREFTASSWIENSIIYT